MLYNGGGGWAFAVGKCMRRVYEECVCMSFEKVDKSAVGGSHAEWMLGVTAKEG